MPSTTWSGDCSRCRRLLEGLRAKAHILSLILGDQPDEAYEDHLTRNILADLLRGI
jgi:hypothetical protein